MPEKDPITCHVLDTLTGRPAPNMAVTLLHKQPLGEVSFSSVTNSDGRIAKWESAKIGAEGTAANLEAILVDDSVWTLRFETEKYYGKGNTFWPYVDLTFIVKKGQHYHVPLLLGPYSYTTYRGS